MLAVCLFPCSFLQRHVGLLRAISRPTPPSTDRLQDRSTGAKKTRSLSGSTTIQETIRVVTRIRPPTEEDFEDCNCLQVFPDRQTLLVNTIGPNNIGNSTKYKQKPSERAQRQQQQQQQQQHTLRQKCFSAKKSKTPNHHHAPFKTESKTPSRIRINKTNGSASTTPKAPSSVTRMFTSTQRSEAIHDVTTDFRAIMTPSSSLRRKSRRLSFLSSTPSRIITDGLSLPNPL